MDVAAPSQTVPRRTARTAWWLRNWFPAGLACVQSGIKWNYGLLTFPTACSSACAPGPGGSALVLHCHLARASAIHGDARGERACFCCARHACAHLIQRQASDRKVHGESKEDSFEA
jgi:hypothetical protein